MTVFGAVFARGGSQGLPGKNLREISGRSLLQIAVDLGREIELIDRVLVSTDSANIAEAARAAKAEVPFLRPAELSGNSSPEWLAWKHLAQHLIQSGASKSDTLVSLPTTAPLRRADDVLRAMALYHDGDFDLVLGVAESHHNPWFNMVLREESGEVSIVLPASGQPVTRRQDAKNVFDITTVVYVTSLGFVLHSSGLLSGKVGSVLIPQERAVDIDSEFDLNIARQIALWGGVEETDD